MTDDIVIVEFAPDSTTLGSWFIDLIKAFRYAFSLGLVEAKNMVDPLRQVRGGRLAMTLDQAAAIEWACAVNGRRWNNFTMTLHLCDNIQAEAAFAALAGNGTFDLSAILPTCHTQ